MLPDDETGAAVVRSTALRLIEKRLGRPLSAGEKAGIMIMQEIGRDPPALNQVEDFARRIVAEIGERKRMWGREQGRIPADSPGKLVMLVTV